MSTHAARDALAGNALFHGVSDEVLDHGVAVTQLIRFSADETIFEQGEPGDYLYLVLKGTVRIRKRGPKGSAESVVYLRAGEFFGEMALFDSDPRSAEAQSVDETLLGRIDRAGLERLLQLAPMEMHHNLLHNTIRRLRDADRQFIKSMVEAERLSLLGTMLDTMIHDFRNPMGVILGATQLLDDLLVDTEARRWTKKIRRATVQMGEMAEEVLEFSRGELTLRREPVAVTRLVEALDEQILDQLPDKGIQVVKELNYEGLVSIDAGRFVRLLVNLIRNAAEAMPRGGVLRIGVSRGEHEVTFTVSDTGTGIPPHILPTIFDPFVTYGKPGGTGLGMAIVKSVVEEHGGTIGVQSVPDEGTTFRVRIPT